MITLENIWLDKFTDDVVIKFSYTGNSMDYSGEMKLNKERWIMFKKLNVPDEEMIQCMLKQELNYMIEYLGA